MSHTFSRARERSISIDGYDVTVFTPNGIDFDANGGEMVDIPLSALKAAIIEDVTQHSQKPGQNTFLERDKTGEPVLATITIEDPEVEPWDSFANVFIDLTISEEITVIIYAAAISILAAEHLKGEIEYTAARFDARLIEVRDLSGSERFESDLPERSWEIYISINSISITVGQLLSLRRELSSQILFSRQEIKSARSAFETIRLGGIERLIGMSESDWLEVKSPPYEMKKDKFWEGDLAKDIACFANSEHGGLLIIGVASKRVEGDDKLIKITPIPSSGKRKQSYLGVLNRMIFPAVEGLQIERFSAGTAGGEILCILVPPQREELKPFLVQGALIFGEHEDGAILIPRRRGEGSIPITAREIHAFLAAGRTHLRSGRGQRSSDNSDSS